MCLVTVSRVTTEFVVDMSISVVYEAFRVRPAGGHI